MNTSIVGRHFELTDPIKEHIETLMGTLEKYQLKIISARAIISAEEKKGKKGYIVEFTINIAKTNTIVIKQRDKDVYSAADLAIDRAHKVLRRHHDKITEHKAISSEEVNAQQILEDEAREAYGTESEIVPMDLDLHKPMEIGEALEILQSSSQQFLVFNDMENKMRVIYKRTDDKYGLY